MVPGVTRFSGWPLAVGPQTLPRPGPISFVLPVNDAVVFEVAGAQAWAEIKMVWCASRAFTINEPGEAYYSQCPNIRFCFAISCLFGNSTLQLEQLPAALR